MTDAERLALFRRKNYQSLLPDLPEMPGFHVCWLTTQTQGGDTIQVRLTQGYSLIKQDELPGFETFRVDSGDYAGCIQVREMLAAKIPEGLYRGYMRIEHHERPQELMDGLQHKIAGYQAEAERSGARFSTESADGIDGLADLRRSAPVPADFI
jgi:hypothetical protein